MSSLEGMTVVDNAQKGKIFFLGRHTIVLEWRESMERISIGSPRLDEVSLSDGSLLNELFTLREKVDYSPFQHKKELGPGPKKKKRKDRREWKCVRSGPYEQICTHRFKSGMAKRKIEAKKATKEKYKKLYRKWDREKVPEKKQ